MATKKKALTIETHRHKHDFECIDAAGALVCPNEEGGPLAQQEDWAGREHEARGNHAGAASSRKRAAAARESVDRHHTSKRR